MAPTFHQLLRIGQLDLHQFFVFRCKVDSTVFFYSMNETMFAFRFQSFKFLDTDQTYIYVHCQSYICDLR